MSYRKITKTLKDGKVVTEIEWDGWDHIFIARVEDEAVMAMEIDELGLSGWQICAATDDEFFLKRERVE